MLDGMPDVSCTLSRYYGLSLFERRSHPQTQAETTPEAVCARAVARGLKRVLQLHFDERGVMSSEAHECR
jgi:hypothetical protein